MRQRWERLSQKELCRCFEMKRGIAIGEKATEHIFHRQGVDRLRHIDVADLWMQDRLRVGKVKSKENVADLGIKQTCQQSCDCETLLHTGLH